jgi:hypothetical protein
MRRRTRDHRRGRSRPIFSLARRRLREIEKIIRLRNYAELDAELYLVPVAQTFRRIFTEKCRIPTIYDLLSQLEVWCELNAPIFTPDQLEAVARKAMRRPRMDTADALAVRLSLTYDDRMLLGITTIGACDLDKAARTRRRKERKRVRDRARAAAKRAARGAITRPEYLERSLSRLRPWEAEGICRRTWERRQH